MGNKKDDASIVPSLFKCPISLDVMKSPVSLCTGVTYDRTSIQRWLDTGNNTCPATMQVLDTKDFVPNHTLQRLIQIWSSNSIQTTNNFHSISSSVVNDLISHLDIVDNNNNKDDVLFDTLFKILCFASESPENRSFVCCNQLLMDYCLSRIVYQDLNPDVLEAVLKILHLMISSSNCKRASMRGSTFELVTTLTRIIKTARPSSRVVAAGIIEALGQDLESKKTVFEHPELVFQLIYTLQETTLGDGETQAVLSCLIFLSSSRRNKQRLVRAGGVNVVGVKLNTKDNNNSNSNSNSNKSVVIELLLTLLEMLAGCAEGRVAISEDTYCVPMIVNKLMKVSKAANEHGVTLLWSLCYLFRDQKVKEAVMRSNGGLTKILLLMQSDCSPAVKRMCCDLLRIFRVNSKSCLSSYDTKTTHIMPC
ncbi:hypothetical protein BVRB_6g133060 [Beta vulgaris subsp. vulgaris]|nr:hypothetical protein BVRB_6g133060 [Beta vulgaris subsp. vulgaris]